MSRRRSSQPQQREQSQVHAASRLVPVTDLPHLAEGARCRGESGRQVRVDDPQPQQVRTAGRGPGQWLGSGQRLRPVSPQYVTVAEIEQAEQAGQQQKSVQADRVPIRGHAFEGLISSRDREGWER
ncbi:hypothetical protein OHB12_33685 [Nocardia sp. NBC_01730]|uniref:hypothetical protein n=1 Tax=Nocardia sp. NBC_01730 TaxID=2975998 RepID=UPI002E1342B9|nr:hypothetical protein OHB12_33685 [Nocardia sp. NBC_01730]